MEHANLEGMDEVYDLLDVAAKVFGCKALAGDIDKPYSTLRNELARQPHYKLGLSTALAIMARTGDMAPLRAICRMFGLLCFEVPRAEPCNPIPFIKMVASTSKSFGTAVSCLGDALEDGKITHAEAKACRTLSDALVEEVLRLREYLDRTEKQTKGGT